ncbi:hypothetical protein OUZ56_012638 [Daphnia magna]|uniref:Uncharacterized protein n=1 Tax=Daphnia magna TaxID=35525 RepID=A0ABQ9Z3M2_9CRUS|nr:hypothetical protein OUZ56_012638 [Daphnia magna]
MSGPIGVIAPIASPLLNNSCVTKAVNEAGPDVVSESEVEPDGDASLYCEALLSSEALLSDDADPAESAGSPAEESGPSAESAGPPAEESGPSDWAWVDF